MQEQIKALTEDVTARTGQIDQLEKGERDLQQTLAAEMIRARESADEKLRIWREGADSKDQELDTLKKMLEQWKQKADEKERLHAELKALMDGKAKDAQDLHSYLQAKQEEL